MTMHHQQQQGSWLMLCAGVVAVLLGASAVLAQPLYDQDGIRAHGTVRRVTANAATCHVLEASHSAEMYQRMKANEGEPLHLWAVDLSVVNESGRWLESLRANFNIESESPPCTNWTTHAEIPGPERWAGMFRVLQRPYGMPPNDEIRETLTLLVFRGQEPTIGLLAVNYEFTDSESAAGVGTGAGTAAEEASLGLDRASRRLIQQGLQASGFDPGGADGLFGPRTRAAIRSWQSSQGTRATGYLDGATVAALRPSVAGQPTFRQREQPAAGASARPAATAVAAARPSASGAPPAAQQGTAEQENLFWQSIVNSTDPADLEAYLEEFPNGVFRRLARNRLAALRSPVNAAPAAVGRPAGGVGSPASGSRVSGAGGAAFGGAAVVDAPRRAGDVFRDCEECPEMVVLPGGGLAMGRYEVTVGEYRAFASATGGGADDCFGDSWRDPGFPQTDRHPVTCVSWDDAQEYVSWLSRRTGATYRLPTEAEWERAAAGSQPGCDRLGRGTRPDGTCPVGSYGTNAAGLSDMVGNLWEWTSDCWEGDCGRRVLRGGSWVSYAGLLRPGARYGFSAGDRFDDQGFRVSRTLD